MLMADIFGPYRERIAGRSPNTAGFSQRGGGKATHRVIIGDKGDGANAITSVAQLHDAMREILGYVEPDSDGFRLHRVAPKLHPLYPWLAAEEITEIVGLGRPTKTEAEADHQFSVDPFEEFALYPAYELNVSFSPRPYVFAQDSEVDTASLTWTKQDGTTATPTYAKEWIRNLEVTAEPGGRYIVAEAGQFQFDVASTLAPDTYNAGKGQLQMFIPEAPVKMTWYQVPWEYVDAFDSAGARIDSYIQQALGCINQHEWMGYDPGTLLLDAVHVARYVQPVPQTDYAADTVVFAPRFLCDITFLFKFLDPPLGKDSAGNAATPRTPPTPPGPGQIITAGWNRVPYAHRYGWYYARTTGQAGFTDVTNKPLYPSFPMQLCFTNPGV